ncbi:toprim domain-containing protein [Neiella sp. HB171785]|uniref:Toprim domain-containing protein n=1 Tax=Neiella litorisoli TaxID=2771431 RepID=A0A8J6QGK8_9GAMM|nr:toprim domain-containing protein [Neiella litorisoli]MBD1389559.1 toprim domain-containing protein [Neiella litorisoli]
MDSKFDKVKALVSKAGWRTIFGAYARMELAIEKADKNPNCPGQVPCPITGKGTTKYRLFPDWETTGEGFHNDFGRRLDGYELIAEFEGSMPRALDAIADILGGDLSSVRSSDVAKAKQNKPERKPVDVNRGKRQLRMLRQTAEKCLPAKDSPLVAKYLESRGLKGDVSALPDCLMFNPNLYHKSDEGKVSYHPALLGLFTNSDGGWVTLHRHYMAADGSGKAPVDNAKKLMPSPFGISGNAIRLDAPAFHQECGLLAVCEGLETALAVREATGLPTWSCYCSDVLALVEIPKEVTHVIIWGDHDRSGAGRRDANKLAERLRAQGTHVRILIPEHDIPEGEKSVDWLDMYRWYGKSVFPYYMQPQFQVYTGAEQVA